MQSRMVVAAIAALGVAVPAAAQDRAARVSAAAIFGGDLARAEQILDAERRVFPNKPEVLLNLAAVYAQTGRVADAAQLYRSVMNGDDVQLSLRGERAVGAHALANAGLVRLGGTQTASR